MKRNSDTIEHEGALELALEGFNGNRGGAPEEAVPEARAMQDASDRGLVSINREVVRGGERGKFGNMDMHGREGGGEKLQIIRICKGSKALHPPRARGTTHVGSTAGRWRGVGCRNAAREVAVIPTREPPQEGLEVQEEEQGAQGVALQGAPAHRHERHPAVKRVKACARIGVQVLDNLHSVGGEAQVVESAQEAIMIDIVESRGEVHVQEVEVLARQARVLKQRGENLNGAASAHTASETALRRTEEAVLLSVIIHATGNTPCPQLVNRRHEADRAIPFGNV
jgi:hypothetical protein